MPITFECQSHWSNIEPTDDGWWWVYALGDYDARRAPVYVGMTNHLARRLAEHARFWTSARANAYVIAVDTEAASRHLEAALIGILEPEGNSVVPHGSWLERRYLASLFTDWDLRSIEVCEFCGCLYRRDLRWDVVTESKDCDSHERPAEPRPDFPDFTKLFPGLFCLPDLRGVEEQPGGDLLEPVPADPVSAEEEGQELIREAFVEGP